MSLKTVVKVGNITNLSDARYCAGMGVDMIGFCLDKDTPHFVDSKTAQEIAGWIAGVSIVGEISTGVQAEVSAYPLAMVEVSTAQQLKDFAGMGAPLIFRFSVDNLEKLDFYNQILSEYQSLVNYFVVESKVLEMNEEIKSLLRKWCAEYPILLGFGINSTNIMEILEEIKPAGISLSGVFEEFSEMLEVIELA